MRNKYLSLIFVTLLLTNFGFAQGVCGTFEGSFEQDKQKHPEFYESLESVNADLEKQYKAALSKMTNFKSEGGKKIIPVVFLLTQCAVFELRTGPLLVAAN